MALVGAAGRLGVSAKAREVRTASIRDGEAISAMLALMGATETVRNWEELRQRREVRATANRLVNFDDEPAPLRLCGGRRVRARRARHGAPRRRHPRPP